MRRFAIGFFPFLVFDLLMGFVSVPVIAATIILSVAYSSYIGKTIDGVTPGNRLRLAVAGYYLLVFVMIAYFLLVLMMVNPWKAAAAIVICAFPLILRKAGPHFCIGLLLNVCVLLFGAMLIPHRPGPEMFRRLENEKHVKPLYLFDFQNGKNGKSKKSETEGVRTIISDSNETALYFSVDHGRVKKGEKKDGLAGDKSAPGTTVSLVRIPREDFSNTHVNKELPTGVKSWSGDRIFGLAFTPGDDRLLATSYYDRKLLIFNPGNLVLQGERATSSYPQFIIMDERGGRVTVTHEGTGIAAIYALPDLAFHGKTKLSSAPSKIVVDPADRTFFAANWMYPYMLTEIEMYSLKTRRKKFFLSFDSAGVDLDLTRGRVYVTKGLTGWIYGVDLKTFEVVDKIKAFPFVRPVCVDVRRGMIYAGGMNEPAVRVYTLDGRQAGRIFTGPNCREIIMLPKSNRVFAGSNLGLFELDVEGFAKDHGINASSSSKK